MLLCAQLFMGPDYPNSSWQAWVVSTLPTELSSHPSKPILNFIHSPKRVTDFSRMSFKYVVYVFSMLAALMSNRSKHKAWGGGGKLPSLVLNEGRLGCLQSRVVISGLQSPQRRSRQASQERASPDQKQVQAIERYSSAGSVPDMKAHTTVRCISDSEQSALGQYRCKGRESR